MKETKSKPTLHKITIKYNYLTLSFSILITICIVLVLINYFKIISIKFSDFISFISSGLIAIGLIYNARSLSFQYEVDKARIEKEDEVFKLNKLRFTYEITSEWFKTNFPHNAEIVRRFMEPYKGKLKDQSILSQFVTFLDTHEGLETRKTLSSNLNYFESISLLLSDNLIDEATLKKAFKTLFLVYYDNLKEYIENIQRGNAGNNARIYKNFVELCIRWRNETN